MVSSRAESIRSFLVMDVLEAAQALEKEGRYIVHLEVGEPDFGAPEHVIETAEKALRAGETKYTHCQGIIELRAAVCEHYRKEYAVAVKPEQVFVNAGSSPAMFSVFGVLLDPGDEVILPNPHYACYPSIISDEIYHGLVYGGKAHSILEFTDRAFVLNGFSKVYGMTGWRLGYTIVPEVFIRPMQKIQQNFFISANAFVQRAGVAALNGPQDHIHRHVQEYDRRRIYLLQRLRDIGFSIETEPTGAFYVLADARGFSGDSHRLAFELLEKAGVAITPGIDFGSNAEGFMRFSYANSREHIAEGLHRLERYLKG